MLKGKAVRTEDCPIQFTDGKAPQAMRTIGEVSDGLGVKSHVLRYWEQQFPMLNPLKRSGGRRLYRPEDVALLVRIDQLVNEHGYTLKGARLVLEGKEDQAAELMSSRSRNAEMVTSLKSIRDRLEAVVNG